MPVPWRLSTFFLQIEREQRADERTRTADLESHYECAVRGCWALQEIANSAFLGGFLYSGLLCISPYCVRGGVRVVSISSSYSPDTVVHLRPARFNLWKMEGQRLHRSDASLKLRSPRSLRRAPGRPLIHVDLLAPYVFLDRPGVLYYPSRVAPSRLWVAVRECSP
jgi:hypothetical protein